MTNKNFAGVFWNGTRGGHGPAGMERAARFGRSASRRPAIIYHLPRGRTAACLEQLVDSAAARSALRNGSPPWRPPERTASGGPLASGLIGVSMAGGAHGTTSQDPRPPKAGSRGRYLLAADVARGPKQRRLKLFSAQADDLPGLDEEDADTPGRLAAVR